MKVAKWTTRQTIIFTYSTVFCGATAAGLGYLVHQYFFDPKFDVVRDRLHTRETIVHFNIFDTLNLKILSYNNSNLYFCVDNTGRKKEYENV